MESAALSRRTVTFATPSLRARASAASTICSRVTALASVRPPPTTIAGYVPFLNTVQSHADEAWPRRADAAVPAVPDVVARRAEGRARRHRPGGGSRAGRRPGRPRTRG